MTGAVLSKSPTCLACVRRLAFGGKSTSLLAPSPTPTLKPLAQTRGKTHGRPKDRGVLVRLLEDIPKFGRKNAIFRTERGRMRNYWYPKQQAEYLTPERLQALGLTKADIGERDTTFAQYVASEDIAADDEPGDEPASMGVELEALSPEKALNLVETMVPKTLTFFGKLIHTPPTMATPTPAAEAPRPKSPLIAEPAPAPPEPKLSEAESRAIFGSVSTTDIAHEVRRFMADDVQASRAVLGPENIRFVALDASTDRVKTIGRFEIDIFMPHGHAEPVRRIVEVLPEEGSRKPSEKAAAVAAAGAGAAVAEAS